MCVDFITANNIVTLKMRIKVFLSCEIKALANMAGGCYSYHKQWSGISPYLKCVFSRT